MRLLFFICVVLVSCKSTRSDKVELDFKSDQIEIDLKEKFKHQRLVAGFGSLGLKYLCHADLEKNICVFAVDIKQKSLEDMIAFFDVEVGVESASKTKGCPEN